MPKKRQSTKSRIVKAAWTLFYKNGYDQTTVDDIITASKTSKGTFYHYFKGKDAEWKGDQLALSSSRNPYEPRVFKSIDGAVAELNRIGIMRLEVIIIDTDITTEK